MALAKLEREGLVLSISRPPGSSSGCLPHPPRQTGVQAPHAITPEMLFTAARLYLAMTSLARS